MAPPAWIDRPSLSAACQQAPRGALACAAVPGDYTPPMALPPASLPGPGDWARLFAQVLTGAELRGLVDEVLGPPGTSALPRRGGHEALCAAAAEELADALEVEALVEALRRHAALPVHRVDALLLPLLPPALRLGRVRPALPAVRLLVGRDAELRALQERLVPGERVALVGPPGSGRRTLAAALAREAMDHLPLVWWIDGATETGIDRGLRELAWALRGDRTGPVDRASLRQEALSWLEAVPDWLLVVADLAEPRRLADRLPAGCGVVLVTTAAAPEGWREHTVGALPPAQGGCLLRRSSGGDGAAEQLSTRLGGHAGALALTGAAIPKNAHLDAVFDEIGRPPEAAAQAAWATALRLARVRLSPEAAALAELLAALGPAPVPLGLLGARVDPAVFPPPLAALVRSPYARADAARELVRRGLGSWRESRAGPALLWLGPQARQAEALDRAAMMLQALAAADAVDEALLDLLLPHLEEAADHGELATETRRWLATWVGRRLDALGEWEGAVAWFQRALAAHDEAEDPPELLAGLLNDLALAWRHAGRARSARDALEQALAIDRARGAPLPLAATLVNLGSVLVDLGQTRAASEARTEALKLREAALGPRHPLTGEVELALALQLVARGELDAARPRFHRARAAFAEARGPHRASLVRALQGQARAEAQLGDAATAVDLGARAHRLLEELHGATDPRTLAARTELADWDDRLRPPGPA